MNNNGLDIKANISTCKGLFTGKSINLPYDSLSEIQDDDIASLIDDSFFPMIPKPMRAEFERTVERLSERDFRVTVTSRNLTHLTANVYLVNKKDWS